jgi:hypothetical protein
MFLQLLMPLSKDEAAGGKKRRWELEHSEAALCILFGGAQIHGGHKIKAS